MGIGGIVDQESHIIKDFLLPVKKVEDLGLHPDAQEALWKIDRRERPKWEAKIVRLNQSG